jgi:hypothetical protein
MTFSRLKSDGNAETIFPIWSIVGTSILSSPAALCLSCWFARSKLNGGIQSLCFLGKTYWGIVRKFSHHLEYEIDDTICPNRCWRFERHISNCQMKKRIKLVWFANNNHIITSLSIRKTELLRLNHLQYNINGSTVELFSPIQILIWNYRCILLLLPYLTFFL